MRIMPLPLCASNAGAEPAAEFLPLRPPKTPRTITRSTAQPESSRLTASAGRRFTRCAHHALPPWTKPSPDRAFNSPRRAANRARNEAPASGPSRSPAACFTDKKLGGRKSRAPLGSRGWGVRRSCRQDRTSCAR